MVAENSFYGAFSIILKRLFMSLENRSLKHLSTSKSETYLGKRRFPSWKIYIQFKKTKQTQIKYTSL